MRKDDNFNTLLLSVFENAEKGMVLFSSDKKLMFYNQKAADMLGSDKLREQITLKEFASLNRINLKDRDALNCSVQCSSGKENSSLPLRCDFKTLKNSDGSLLGHVMIFSDIALETDVLTGFHNWESFKLFAIKNPGQFVPPISVAILDINALAMINSSFGRNEGDRLIIELSDIMKRNFPEDTYFVREHEAHLVAICRNVSEDDMKGYVDRIKQDFSGHIQYALNMTSEEMPELVEAVREASKGMKTKKLLDLNSSHSELIATLVKALEECDGETRQHVQRTMEIGQKLGTRLGLTDIQLSNLSLLCMLHDIGKIGIPLEILNKPEKLTEDEWVVMRSHTEKGYQIAASAKELESIADMVLHHHERWDGMGYPDGLSKESIPVLSRVISVIDSFDAMVNDRVYRSALTLDSAVDELRRCAGSQFDPHIVSEFIAMIKEERANMPSDETDNDNESVKNVRETEPEEINFNPVSFSRYILDENSRIIYADDSFEKFTGYSSEDIKKGVLTQTDLIPENDRLMYMQAVSRQLSESPRAFFEHYLKKKNGDVILVLCFGEALTDPETCKTVLYVTISNIMHTRAVRTMLRSEQEKAQKRLRQWETQYRSDPLTGLMNHSAFESDVEAKLLAASGKVMMIMIDFDRFKEYNDTHGHKKGDEFLIIAARNLASLIREGDLACRMGGDEFALALFFRKDLDNSKIYARAEHIFNELCVSLGSVIADFAGVSMGAAVSDDDHYAFSTLYEAADRMLYKSKENGRNRITCLHSEET